MTKKDEQQRQQLVDDIVNGRYANHKSGNSSEGVIVGVFFVFALILMVFTMFRTLMSGAGRSNSEAMTSIMGLIGVIGVFVFFMVVIVALSARSQGMKLNSLTEAQRWLILNGDKIEADVDSIDKNGRLFSIACKANYQGQDMQFRSPAFDVEPIPFEERKITVYINPEAPNHYFIDIFSHLPYVGENFLTDRSEMKCEPGRVYKGKDGEVIVILMLLFIAPVALFFMTLGIQLMASKHALIGFFVMAIMPLFAGLVIWKLLQAVHDKKRVLANGYYILAKGDRFWVTHSKNSTTNHLSVRYIEPSTKQVHSFRTTGPSSMRQLVGASVRVYIDPLDLSRYYCDIDTSLRELGFTTSQTRTKE